MARVDQRARRSERLLNRELSWLDFNERVLDLVDDASVPLLERVKFCSIFSSNLDEFFMVRAAGLTRQSASGLAMRSADGRTPKEALAAIRVRVVELTGVSPTLGSGAEARARGGRDPDGPVEDCTDDDLAWIASVCSIARSIPVLTPLAVGPGQPFPYISGLSLSIGLFVRDPETGDERFARVKVPEGLPRFLTVGERGLVRAARVRDRALPALALPGHGDRRVRAVPRHPRRRLRGRRTRPTTCSRPSSSRSAAGASAT